MCSLSFLLLANFTLPLHITMSHDSESGIFLYLFPSLLCQVWKSNDGRTGGRQKRGRTVSVRGTENEKDRERKQVATWKRQFKLSPVLLVVICHHSAPLSLHGQSYLRVAVHLQLVLEGTDRGRWWVKGNRRWKETENMADEGKRKKYCSNYQLNGTLII